MIFIYYTYKIRYEAIKIPYYSKEDNRYFFIRNSKIISSNMKLLRSK
jgi:hypothetical protein